MKKVVSLLLCVCLLLCLVGCSLGQETGKEDANVPTGESSGAFESDASEDVYETSRYIVSAEILLEDFNQAKHDHFFDFSSSSDIYYVNLYLDYNDGSMETYSFMFDVGYGTDPDEMGVVYHGTNALVRDANYVGGGSFYLLNTQNNTCEFVCDGTYEGVEGDLVYIERNSMDEGPEEITVFNIKTGRIEDVYYE